MDKCCIMLLLLCQYAHTDQKPFSIPDKPIFQHNTSKNLYYPDVIRNPDPVLPMSPASRPIKFSEKIYPSPVATVAPLMRKVEVKEEAPSDGMKSKGQFLKS